MCPAPSPPSGIATCGSSLDGTQGDVRDKAGGGVLGGVAAMERTVDAGRTSQMLPPMTIGIDEILIGDEVIAASADDTPSE